MAERNRKHRRPLKARPRTRPKAGTKSTQEAPAQRPTQGAAQRPTVAPSESGGAAGSGKAPAGRGKAARDAGGIAGHTIGGSGGGKERGRTEAFWLHGSHAVLAALANPRRPCRRLLVTAEAWQRNESGISAALRGRKGLQPETCERAVLDRLAPESGAHQGLLLEVESLPAETLESFLSNSTETIQSGVSNRAGVGTGAMAAQGARQEAARREIVVVLDQIEDPRNLGAILRSAAAFGVAALILQDRHSPPESGILAKTACGALERLPLIRVANLARALANLKAAGYWCLGLDEQGPKALSSFIPDRRTALVLGAEGPGLRRLTREACDVLVKLPTNPDFPVLNVSNAAAVALYELRCRG